MQLPIMRVACGRCQTLCEPKAPDRPCWYCFAQLCAACAAAGHCGHEMALLVLEMEAHAAGGRSPRFDRVVLMWMSDGQLRAMVAAARARAGGVTGGV